MESGLVKTQSNDNEDPIRRRIVACGKETQLEVEKSLEHDRVRRIELRQAPGHNDIVMRKCIRIYVRNAPEFEERHLRCLHPRLSALEHVATNLRTARLIVSTMNLHIN